MDSNKLSLRKLATILGVSQPFLSQIRAGKRPLPDALKRKVEALGAYHLLITGGREDILPGDAGAGPGVVLGTKIGGTDWVRTSDLALMKYLC